MLEPNALKSSSNDTKDRGDERGEPYQKQKQSREKMVQIYLHPAILNRWAYIAPISPIPITPMLAFSLLSTILRDLRPSTFVPCQRLSSLAVFVSSLSFSCLEEEIFARFNLRPHRHPDRPVPPFCRTFPPSHVPRLIITRDYHARD